jgi:hypothetical protein
MQQGTKETIGMSIVFLFIMGLIQWLLLWLTHWSVALIITELITFFVVSYVIALSHARPNGGSKGPATSVFLKPLLIIVSMLLCTLWTLSYLMHKPLPNLAVIVPLGVVLAFGIINYIYRYIKIRSFWYKNYSLCKLEIENKSEGLTFIEFIKFMNSNSYSMDINPNNLQWLTKYIPQNMDRIAFRFNTNETNRSIYQEFPFDYSLCQEKSTFSFDFLFWIRQKSVAPIKLTILPNNKVDLYIDNRLIQHFQLTNQDS